MNCPYCGSVCAPTMRVCPECGLDLPTGAETMAPRAQHQKIFHGAFIAFSWILSLAIICFLIYNAYFWIDAYKIERIYSRGERTPVVNEVLLSDGRVGHSITFFADDGDQIFVEELEQSYIVAGGFARVEIADSEWFYGGLANVESAQIALTPILIEENGSVTRLPLVTLTVDVPESPITVVSPEVDGLEVYTAIYPLEIQTVPGSRVSINGNDVTDIVDRSGLLSYNMNVYPIGDNLISVLVRTPNHNETRRDIIIYRAAMEIDLELALNTPRTSSTKTMTVSGSCEPGAMIEIDSDHVPESVYIDMETGDFKFLARFNTIGDNTVSFRATMDGKSDSTIRFTVYYIPAEGEYTSSAWKMDYKDLYTLFEQRHGKIFLCEGTAKDVYKVDDKQYVALDVGTSGQEQLVILEIMTSKNDYKVGKTYKVYADVSGRIMYNSAYYPLLIARYGYDGK